MSHSLFTEFVQRLGVPCTVDYSDSAFATMPFKSLFGLSGLLKKYGVDNAAFNLPDKEAVASLPTPFLAQYKCSFVVVDQIGPKEVTISDGERESTVTLAKFLDNFGGNVLLAWPSAASTEPKVAEHRTIDFAKAARPWVLAVAAALIVAYLIATRGLYRSWSAWAVLAINGLGFYASYLLVLKGSGVKSDAGDAICGVIERTGCHTVLGTAASKFFGIFGWSEVGLSYFGVSILTLLLYPEAAGWLALVNACACPFSFWSVWYQKYRAKAWCTLCLTVQSCLWIALACEIIGGWFRTSFPLGWGLVPLIAAYVVTLLTSNTIAETLSRLVNHHE